MTILIRILAIHETVRNVRAMTLLIAVMLCRKSVIIQSDKKRHRVRVVDENRIMRLVDVRNPDTYGDNIAPSERLPDTYGDNIAPSERLPDTYGDNIAPSERLPDTYGDCIAPSERLPDTYGDNIAPSERLFTYTIL